MNYPKSEHLGMSTSPDGAEYSLHFYGENEGAAVVTGPIPRNAGRLVRVAEVHREPATDAADARAGGRSRPISASRAGGQQAGPYWE